MRRDLAKTISFAAMHFSVAFAIAYALTGSLSVATGMGLIEPFANTVAFYFHEKLWARVPGRQSVDRFGGQDHAPSLCAAH